MEQNDFFNLFIKELRDLFSAETQLVKAIPKIKNAATSNDLREAFETHLQKTRGQVSRLEEIFTSLNESPQGVICRGMQGLIQEGEEIMQSPYAADVKDAALIAVAQRIEHYEIACYGVVKAFAQQLDLDEIASMLDESLDEESEADKLLSSIAEGGFFTTGVNKRASQQRS